MCLSIQELIQYNYHEVSNLATIKLCTELDPVRTPFLVCILSSSPYIFLMKSEKMGYHSYFLIKALIFSHKPTFIIGFLPNDINKLYQDMVSLYGFREKT